PSRRRPLPSELERLPLSPRDPVSSDQACLNTSAAGACGYNPDRMALSSAIPDVTLASKNRTACEPSREKTKRVRLDGYCSHSPGSVLAQEVPHLARKTRNFVGHS